MKKLVLSVVAALVVTGCASTSDIDTSKADQSCVQPCSHNYSTCVSKFTFFPIQVQHQCTDAYRLCVQGCPERAAPATQQSPTEKLDKLKALRDTGVITQKEYEAKRKVIVDGL